MMHEYLLDPLLFSFFINDLVRKVSAHGKGVAIGPVEQIRVLLYADDIVLITESEENLHGMFNRPVKCLVPEMWP